MYIFHNFISLTKTNVTRLPSLTLAPIQALWLVESVSRGSSFGKGINFVVWEKYLQLGRAQTRRRASLQPDQPACLAWPASLPCLTSLPACLPASLPSLTSQPACLPACLPACVSDSVANRCQPEPVCLFSRVDYLVSLFSAIFGGFTFF